MRLDWGKCCDFGLVGRLLLHAISLVFASVITFVAVCGALGESDCADAMRIQARMAEREVKSSDGSEQCECERAAPQLWRPADSSRQRQRRQPDGAELLFR